MAKYLTLPNGDSIKVPDNMSYEEAMAKAQAKFPQLFAEATPAQAPRKSATVGDLGYSALSGIGSLVSFPGNLYGLATGDMDNSLSRTGKAISDYARARQSEGLKQRQAEQQKAISEAGKEGFLSEMGTAISSTVKDPVLLGNFLAENIPNLVPGFGVARGTVSVGTNMAMKRIAAEGLTGDAARIALETAQKGLAKKAEALAVGTAVTQQGTDVGAGAYTDVYKKLKAQGMSDEDAAAQALSLARSAGASGAVISYLTTRLPGARALEKAFVGKGAGSTAAFRGAVKGALGEGVSEGIEEGGGRLVQNAAIGAVDPTQDILAGVGQAAGLGTVLGGVLGGGAGAINANATAAAEAERTARATAAQQAEEEAELEKLKTDPRYAKGLMDEYTRLRGEFQQASRIASAKLDKKSDTYFEDLEAQKTAKKAQRELGEQTQAVLRKLNEIGVSPSAAAAAVVTRQQPTQPAATQPTQPTATQPTATAPTATAPGAPVTPQARAGTQEEAPSVFAPAPFSIPGTEAIQEDLFGAPAKQRAQETEIDVEEQRARYGQLLSALRNLGAMDNEAGTGKIPGLLQDYQQKALNATDPAEIARYSRLYNQTLERTRELYDEVNQLHTALNTQPRAPRMPALAKGYETLQADLEAARAKGDMQAVQQAAEALQANIDAGGRNALNKYRYETESLARERAYDADMERKQRKQPVESMPTRDLFGAESTAAFNERTEAARAEQRKAEESRAQQAKELSAQRNAPTGPIRAEESGEPESMAIQRAREEAEAAAERLRLLQERADKARTEFAEGKRAPEPEDARATAQADLFAEPEPTVRRSRTTTSLEEIQADRRAAVRQRDSAQPGTPEYNEAVSAIRAADEMLSATPPRNIRAADEGTANLQEGLGYTPKPVQYLSGQRAGRADTESLQAQIDALPADMHPDDAALVNRMQDNLPAIAGNAQAAEAAREWLYRARLGTQQVLRSTDGPLKYRKPGYKDAARGRDTEAEYIGNFLDAAERAGRSESETFETPESVAARNRQAVNRTRQIPALQQRVAELHNSLVESTKGRLYSHLYRRVLGAMRRESVLTDQLLALDSRIEDAERSLKDSDSYARLETRRKNLLEQMPALIEDRARAVLAEDPDAISAVDARISYARESLEGANADAALKSRLNTLKSLWKEYGKLNDKLDAAKEAKRMARIQLYAQSGGTDPNRAAFEELEQAQTALGRIAQEAPPTPVYDTITGGVQKDMFSTNWAAFDTPQQFAEFMAGEGLQRYRASMGLVGITASRADNLAGDIRQKIAAYKAQIDSAERARKDMERNRATTEGQLNAARDAAVTRLNMIEGRIDRELQEQASMLTNATQAFDDALAASAAIDQLLKDHAAFLGRREEAFADALDAAADAKKSLTHATNNKAPEAKLAELQARAQAADETVAGFLDTAPKALQAFAKRQKELRTQRDAAQEKLRGLYADYATARESLLEQAARLDAIYGPEMRKAKSVIEESRAALERLRTDAQQRAVTGTETVMGLEQEQKNLEALMATVSATYKPAVEAELTQSEREQISNERRQAEQRKLEVTGYQDRFGRPLPATRLVFDGHRRLVESREKAMGTAAAYAKVISHLRSRVEAGETDPTVKPVAHGDVAPKPITMASAEAAMNRSLRRAARLDRMLDRSGERVQATLEADYTRAKTKVDEWQAKLTAARGQLSAASRKANADASAENIAAKDTATKQRNTANDELARWNKTLEEARAARDKGPGIYGMQRQSLQADTEVAQAYEEDPNYEPASEYEVRLLAEGRLPPRRESVLMREIGSAAGHGFRTSSPESLGKVTQTLPNGRVVTVGPRENPRNPPTEVGRVRDVRAPFGAAEQEKSNRVAEEVAQQQARLDLQRGVEGVSPEQADYDAASTALTLAENEAAAARNAVARAQAAVDEKPTYKGVPTAQRRALPMPQNLNQRQIDTLSRENLNRQQDLKRAQDALAAAEVRLTRAQRRFDKATDAIEAAVLRGAQQKSAKEGGESRLIADDAVPDYAVTEKGTLRPPKKGAGLTTKADREAKVAATRVNAALDNPYADELYDSDWDNQIIMRGTSGPNDTPLGMGALRALGKGDLRAALAQVAANSKNPIAKRLAAQYAALVSGVRVHLVDEMPGNSPNAPGGTSRNGMHVLLNRETGLSEETLLHEVAHALTIHNLSIPDSQLTPEQRAAKRELEAMHEEVKRADDIDNDVVKDDDIKEFVAESYGSNQVQRAMQNREWSYGATTAGKAQYAASRAGGKGRFRSMWDAFKAAVMRFIKAPIPPSGPMQDRFLELADKFLRTPQEKDVVSRGEEIGSYRDPLSAALKRGYSGDRSLLGIVKENKDNLFTAIRQNVADQRASLRDAVAMVGTKDQKTEAAFTITMLDATVSNTMTTLANGAFKLDSKGNFVGGKNTSFVDVLNEIAKFPGIKGEEALNLFHMQRVANRADAIPDGWRVLAGSKAAEWKQKAQVVRKAIAASPELKAAVDRANKVYNDYNRGKIELLRDTYALPEDVVQKMLEDKDYVPFYRQHGDSIKLIMPDGHPYSVGDIRTNPMMRSLKGGDETLLNFVDSEVKNAHLLTQLAVENKGKEVLAARMEMLGATRKQQPRGVPTMRIRVGKAPRDANAIEFRVAPTSLNDTGDRHLIIDTEGTIAENIPTALLTQAFAGSYATQNLVTDLSHGMASLLRTAVTRFPAYTIRQLFREPFSASVQGSVRSSPPMAIIKSIWEYGKIMANASEDAKTLQKQGIVESNVFSGYQDLDKVARQITNGSSWWGDKIAYWLDKSAIAADTATRVQAYRDVKAAGGTEQAALLHAREMQNFSRRGGAAWVQFLSHSIPFFNSSIQSMATLLRSAHGKMPAQELLQTRQKFAMRAAGMVAMAMYYYSVMSDDPEWLKLPLRDKIAYIHLPFEMGGEKIRLPAPFEVGLYFYSLPIAYMEHMRQELTPDEWKAVRNAVFMQTPGGGAPLPLIAKLPVELASNYNFTFGSDIVPEGKQKLPAEQQYGSATSEMARRAGELTGLSPMKIDYAMSQLIGSWTKIIGGATDKIFQKAEEADIEKPTSKLSENPIYGSFFQSKKNTADIGRVYEVSKHANGIKSGYDALVKEGDLKAAEKYHKEHALQIAMAPALGKMASELSNLSTMETKITNADLTQAQKDTALERIRARRKELAENYRRVILRVFPNGI